jgi:8-oxo-dGTP pyrophosphatase MutT (NUDIX family)
MPFLGGMYCYPGGAVGKQDFSSRMIERSIGLSGGQARKIMGAHLVPQQALGFWIAAVRELFEEVGILLAMHESGERFPKSQPHARRLLEKHRALLDKSTSFISLLERNDLRCDLASLVYFSHWQTPSQVSLRFDTRFFVALLPEEQTPLESSYEVSHSLWLAPERAMQLHQRGELPLIFPTFVSLRTLADFDTLESVFEEFRTNTIAPISTKPAPLPKGRILT